MGRGGLVVEEPYVDDGAGIRGSDGVLGATSGREKMHGSLDVRFRVGELHFEQCRRGPKSRTGMRSTTLQGTSSVHALWESYTIARTAYSLESRLRIVTGQFDLDPRCVLLAIKYSGTHTNASSENEQQSESPLFPPLCSLPDGRSHSKNRPPHAALTNAADPEDALSSNLRAGRLLIGPAPGSRDQPSRTLIGRTKGTGFVDNWQ
ncbi:uncharacterized protein CIMG_13418 [Coccidioides immitis RS]|uniref:Uncharacterized protein n=2 Tax=Coccidioides immitis TaxID=5501 RepID=A0A0E1S3Q1_COCIM|nr:uncharacterized protein CIMG_13418 [Coccidioides immitis RS]EAS34074.1 hypothetical protein CIMG_13418 [Coccidioides immitis RS]KMU77828.1 hypothetical protein CISG_01584 [Coccidioides immitis RMSCC 3703]